MLTKLEHRMLKFCVFGSSFIFTYPFSWDSQDNFLKWSPKCTIWRRAGNAFGLITTGAHVVYLIVRFIPGYGYTSSDWKPLHYSIVIHALYLAALMVDLIVQIGVYLQANELAELVNQLLHFNKSNGGRLLGINFEKPNLREKLVAIFIISGLNVAWSIVLVTMSFPNNIYTLFSCVPNEWKNWLTFIVAGGFEAYALSKAIMIDLFAVNVAYTYLLTNWFWFRKMALECNELLHENKLAMYRNLAILNTMYNNSFAPIMFPALKFTLESMGMMCALGLFRLYHSTNKWIYSYFAVCGPFVTLQAIAAIIFMAGVYEGSNEIKTQHKAQRHSKASTRVVNSWKPIYCRVGNLFFVEKSTKLDYIHLLLDSFISILLTI